MRPTHSIIRSTGLALALFTAACGSGGGRDTVRTQPPPPRPPDPPPSFNPCPPPVTSDCNVDLAPDRSEHLPATDSDHGLVLQGGGALHLESADYRFQGGTRIGYGTLHVGYAARLRSDVLVAEQGRLALAGVVRGDIVNRGWTELHGRVEGNFDNSGLLQLQGVVYGDQPRITGDFVQSADGVFAYALVSLSDWQPEFVVPLQVDGRADLAGTLELRQYTDSWGPYALPDARAHHLIHADQGVFGRFSGWTSPGLAITGALRYGANDVWFDLERVSMEEAVAARGIGGALSRRSAANLDRAFAAADAFALAPGGPSGDVQRRFLRSAASVMWLQDDARAARSLDSLSGHAHADAIDAMHRDAADATARLDARLARNAYATGATAWTLPSRGAVRGGQLAGGATSGVDQWLSPRLLVGGSVSDGRASLGFDRMGGFARGEASRAGLHVHYRGSGWHASAAAGAGRARLDLHRAIELGAAGRHSAMSRRELDLGFAHGELGRALHVGGGSLVPFVALDYAFVRGNAFVEHGDTGFELVAGRSRQSRLGAAAGTRYARGWRVGEQELWLELDARYRRDLVDGEPVRAAFVGVPDAAFDLPARRGSEAGELRMGLGGSAGKHSRWYLDYAASFGREHRDRAWEAGLLHAF